MNTINITFNIYTKAAGSAPPLFLKYIVGLRQAVAQAPPPALVYLFQIPSLDNMAIKIAIKLVLNILDVFNTIFNLGTIGLFLKANNRPFNILNILI